ncbi:MAG: transglycosylase domain-containing protein [Deltaproteobacteria bacterium]|nr:transglycosylase domain-containing protein [Deltaproteobacteria bacterium]MBI3295523.1 transglycosylase domain-containing protein [Deltaproteobacteria bacterium]
MNIDRRRLVILVAISFIGTALMSVVLMFSYGVWVSQQINAQFDQLRGKRPSRIYAAWPGWTIGTQFRLSELERLLTDYGYQAGAGEEICSSCFHLTGTELTVHRAESTIPGAALGEETFKIQLDVSGPLATVQLITDRTGGEVVRVDHRPLRVGVFSAGRLRTQDFVPMAEIPVYLRLAVMGIEDASFLEHSGVSMKAILRALWRDLTARRFAQGGSTITQQLMKNLFFSHEKVMTRKFKEAFYALLAEYGHSKEEILEAYLNEVYLGQWSSHEIHGVNEGARYYFNTRAADLSLAQSAVLAALIQAPNFHDPKRNPERLKSRRDLVLKRMFESNFIVEEEYRMAVLEPLIVSNTDAVIEGIDYYLELALSEMPESLRGRLDTGALTLLLPINPRLQQEAAVAIRIHLKELEDRIAKMRKKNPPHVSLEGALIAVSVPNCEVLATQGGRGYRLSPFNRILQGRRQLGSLAKPFVFLASLLSSDPIKPDTMLSDSPFEWEYDRQIWKPKNYENEFLGDVTAREVLEKSLNVPTARLAQMVGVPAIVDTMKKAGVTSDFMPVPSIALGSEELSPYELAEAYLTIARQGKSCRMSSVLKAYDENGNELYNRELMEKEVFPKDSTSTLIDMMHGVLTHGTAKYGAAPLGEELNYFAGKTGTTSEYRDAWFIGFSPDLLVLVWVGYDERELVGLTGASAALPIWTSFLKAAKPYYLPRGY